MTVTVTQPSINVREKLAELDKPTGIAGEAMLRAETPQEQQALIGVGRRNLIINGAFQVSQRGDYSSATATQNNVYTLDRFKLALALVSATVQHNEVVLPNGVKTMAMKVAATSTSSTGYAGVRQVIEDFRVLSEQIVTVSMWIRTTLQGMTFRHDSTTNFGGTIVPDGQWHYHTATYQMPTITAAGGNANETTLAIINYSDALGSGAGVTSGEYFEITQVQLELGKVATPFEHRSYGEELNLAQRYFQAHISGNLYTGFGFAHGSSTTDVEIFGYRYLVPMRSAPTLSASAAGDFSIRTSSNNIAATPDAIVINRPGTQMCNLSFQYSGGGLTTGNSYHIVANNNSAATLTFDAEL